MSGFDPNNKDHQKYNGNVGIILSVVFLLCSIGSGFATWFFVKDDSGYALFTGGGSIAMLLAAGASYKKSQWYFAEYDRLLEEEAG